MLEHGDVLVASSDLEDRTSLLHILDSLSINAISCRSLEEIREVLSRQDVLMIFCDESFGGGTYRDLFRADIKRKHRPVVVTIRTGDWNECLEAMRLGAFDAVRYPLHPTDVELVVLRALRERREAFRYRMTA